MKNDPRITRAVGKESYPCTKCKEEKPAAAFRTRAGRGRTMSSWCRECTQNSVRESQKRESQ